MKNIIRLTFPLLIFSICLIIYETVKYYDKKEKEKHISIQLNELRSVAKLVLWEQSFTLSNTESISKKYFGLIETKESVHSTIDGKMGFHIDLADSIQTEFIHKNDTVFINAPLKNTYISLELGTLNQVKESSLDPSLEISKEEVIKNLQNKAIEEVVPGIKNQLDYKTLKYQESKLSELIGLPVKISIKSFPTSTEMKWSLGE